MSATVRITFLAKDTPCHGAHRVREQESRRKGGGGNTPIRVQTFIIKPMCSFSRQIPVSDILTCITYLHGETYRPLMRGNLAYSNIRFIPIHRDQQPVIFITSIIISSIS